MSLLDAHQAVIEDAAEAIGDVADEMTGSDATDIRFELAGIADQLRDIASRIEALADDG